MMFSLFRIAMMRDWGEPEIVNGEASFVKVPDSCDQCHSGISSALMMNK